MIIGYANGYAGYIPDVISYEADSYETNPTIMHRAGQYTGDKIMEEWRIFLQELIFNGIM